MNTTQPLLCTLILLCTLGGCVEPSLPTIGRSVGDVPMTKLIEFDNDNQCYRFIENVSFASRFADGMAYAQATCLKADKKIGRISIENLATMHVSLTSDGEYYIVKGGY